MLHFSFPYFIITKFETYQVPVTQFPNPREWTVNIPIELSGETHTRCLGTRMICSLTLGPQHEEEEFSLTLWCLSLWMME